MQTCFMSNQHAIRYDHYQLSENSPSKNSQGARSKDFVECMPKDFSRRDKIAGNMYFRKIASH